MSSACRLVGDNWWIGGSRDVVLQFSDSQVTISQRLDIKAARALGAALILRSDELEQQQEKYEQDKYAGDLL